GLTFYVFNMCFVRSCRLFLPMNGYSPMQTFTSVFYSFEVIFIGLYCVVSSYVINRRWRKIVEEDIAKPCDTAALELSSLSINRIWKFFCYCLPIPLIVVLPSVAFTLIMIELHGNSWTNYFGYIPFIFSLRFVVLPYLYVVFILFVFCFAAKRMVVDTESLTNYKPKISNFLQVLTGKEQPPHGLRFRTNIWNDLLLVGLGMCMVQATVGRYYAWYLPTASLTFAECGGVMFYTVSFLAYIYFAVFYAGIPGKRYTGYIHLGSFLMILDAVFMLCEQLLYFGTGRIITIDSWAFGFMLFWLGCFIMVGVAGRYAFRKER
ncbi:MAG: hypothetical protein ACRC2T_09140, partial [Thermoguttaceae bacterium]